MNEANTYDVQALGRLVDQRFGLSTSLPEQFFQAEAPAIADACWAMARRFHQGSRLFAFGNGASATDAQHISVEFVHPVIVGKRALPALALTNDSAALSALAGPGGVRFSQQLATLARPQDIALGISGMGSDENVVEALREAKQRGLLTLGLAGGDAAAFERLGLDFCFVVPSSDRMVVQEVHETLYHVLWELVHIFFEHDGLLN